MLQHTTREDGRIVEFTLDGDFDKPEVEALLGSLRSGIAKHGTIRVLEHVRKVGKVPPSAVWPDLMFGIDHIRDIDRAAVVSDRKWIGLFTRGAASLIPGEVRLFAEAELQQARQWLCDTSPGLHLQGIYAHVACRDIAASEAWYTTLFGRPNDASPMPSLREWHHRGCTGIQLFEDPERAGQSTVTLLSHNLRSDREMLTERGFDPGKIERGEAVRLIRLHDPDGNLVVLVQRDARA